MDNILRLNDAKLHLRSYSDFVQLKTKTGLGVIPYFRSIANFYSFSSFIDFFSFLNFDCIFMLNNAVENTLPYISVVSDRDNGCANSNSE